MVRDRRGRLIVRINQGSSRNQGLLLSRSSCVEGKRACRIRKDFEIGGYSDEEKWPEIHDALIDAMILLEKAFRPRIAKIK